MFIIECDCGNELYISSGDDRSAWQCDACGKWLNFFGQEVRPPQEAREQALFKDYDPDFDDEE